MMNSLSIIRQTAMYEKVCECKTGGTLYFPREDLNSGRLYVLSSTGEIFLINEGTSDHVLSGSGQINGLCIDSNDSIYVTEITTAAIYCKAQINDNLSTTIDNLVVKEYDNTPLKGPTCMAYNIDENVLYFADSGNFLSGSLYPNNSAIYAIDLESRIMRPILSNNLSFVSDIYYDKTRGHLYVAETFANRILRLAQNPNGVFYSSVFYQFSGRVGPTAVTMDEMGNIYVARYEYIDLEEEEVDGIISVLNSHGTLVGELRLPKLPEITGLYISPKKRENLYVTEKNTTGVLKIKLLGFTSEIDKLEELLKS